MGLKDGAANAMSQNQAIVWINDEQARIMSVDTHLCDRVTICALTRPDPQGIVENAAVSEGATYDAGSFFYRVARALDWADEILIVGPSNTKVSFLAYMHKDEHAIDPRILGVETIEHPTDSALRGFAELYFAAGGIYRAGHAPGCAKPE